MQRPIESIARFTAMPDDETLATTVAALEARGFGTEVVEDLNAAREAVLARIPHGPRLRPTPRWLRAWELLRQDPRDPLGRARRTHVILIQQAVGF